MTAETLMDGVPTGAPARERTGGRARSPLAGYVELFAAAAAATGGAVRIAEQPLLAQLTLRADPATDLRGVLGGPLPAPGVAIGDGTLRTLGLGPDEWLVVGPPGAREPVAERLRAQLAGNGAVVDVSGQRTTMTLTGPKSREVLAKGCSIDLHPRVFHGARCAQTMLARAQVVIAGQPDQPEVLWLLAGSSFARYVADWLLDATVEYRLDSEVSVP